MKAWGDFTDADFQAWRDITELIEAEAADLTPGSMVRSHTVHAMRHGGEAIPLDEMAEWLSLPKNPSLGDD